MKPANLLIIMSDEHDPRWMGCSGNALMHTPNLDRLAARGLRFTDAYTTCPICVPARAARRSRFGVIIIRLPEQPIQRGSCSSDMMTRRFAGFIDWNSA